MLRDELEEYFKLPREDFDLCSPLEWWVGRQAQFPNLYCLATDILSIPGMFDFWLPCATWNVYATLCQDLPLQLNVYFLVAATQSHYAVQVCSQGLFKH